MRGRVRSDGFTSLLSVVEAGADPRVQFDFVSDDPGAGLRRGSADEGSM